MIICKECRSENMIYESRIRWENEKSWLDKIKLKCGSCGRFLNIEDRACGNLEIVKIIKINNKRKIEVCVGDVVINVVGVKGKVDGFCTFDCFTPSVVYENGYGSYIDKDSFCQFYRIGENYFPENL